MILPQPAACQIIRVTRPCAHKCSGSSKLAPVAQPCRRNRNRTRARARTHARTHTNDTRARHARTHTHTHTYTRACTQTCSSLQQRTQILGAAPSMIQAHLNLNGVLESTQNRRYRVAMRCHHPPRPNPKPKTPKPAEQQSMASHKLSHEHSPPIHGGQPAQGVEQTARPSRTGTTLVPALSQDLHPPHSLQLHHHPRHPPGRALRDRALLPSDP